MISWIMIINEKKRNYMKNGESIIEFYNKKIWNRIEKKIFRFILLKKYVLNKLNIWNKRIYTDKSPKINFYLCNLEKI